MLIVNNRTTCKRFLKYTFIFYYTFHFKPTDGDIYIYQRYSKDDKRLTPSDVAMRNVMEDHHEYYSYGRRFRASNVINRLLIYNDE